MCGRSEEAACGVRALGPPRAPGLFAVEETARRVGNYKWIEMRLFEALGGWVATVPELDVKLRLGRHCYHHAWHAELWHKRLPELREMNPDRLTAPGQRRVGRVHGRVREPEAPDQTIEKLVGVYRVLIPRKIAVYTYHLQQHEPDHRRADDPLARLRPPGRVRGLARRRDAAPVAHRDPRGGRAGRRPPGRSSRSSWSPPAASRPGYPGRRLRRRRHLRRGMRPDQEGTSMKKPSPPSELARDDRFVRADIDGRDRRPPERAPRPPKAATPAPAG